MSSFEEVKNGKSKKPSGSEARQKPRIIGFRVTDTDRAEIEAAASRSGLTVGSYIRAQVLKAPKTRAVKKPPIERTMLAQLLGQLGRVGGNIHQIVKRMNFNEGVIRTELEAALADFRETAAAIMQAMGRRSP